MAYTPVIRLAGSTTKVAVTATASSPVVIKTNTNNQIDYAAFLNAGSKPCAVAISPVSASATFPGASAGDFVLPASMTYPLIIAVPARNFYVSAICDGTDTTTLYVTPVEDQ